MKTFFKDFWELQKGSCRFMKKHPVGTVLYVLGSMVIGGATAYGYAGIQEKKIEKSFEEINFDLEEEA